MVKNIIVLSFVKHLKYNYLISIITSVHLKETNILCNLVLHFLFEFKKGEKIGFVIKKMTFKQ